MRLLHPKAGPGLEAHVAGRGMASSFPRGKRTRDSKAGTLKCLPSMCSIHTERGLAKAWGEKEDSRPPRSSLSSPMNSSSV